ncbi:Asp-tRNA(Asn)/Glu-tRNA(Gln) amidotransferase subunit GatB [archaeon]|nr:Asp-tRNA(Asn)/Glu-tRNA(Gln) amidotransferase subunit GatB [archaeon]MBT6823816.1 Asp-tRNA(Asn)/Glu-tRNA(Gln) amidotransferase subunit GatB [archaeon]MBT7107149.1 Asp-tRNA(Asn)/Glu-tRNA(Gln) amidotransferase subunit GatB [archaeon]MBT7297259.1 Asp-tRNA(Asn)/Glu-tRNA(Gln) amidotransferase subunit GatB [archaeon]
MKFKSDVVIGLEIHVELDTNTKLFCGCRTSGNDKPNTRVCPICLGHPGARPVLNKKALDYAIKLCLATDSTLTPEVIFSRKSYFYPDMSKNFQISQYEEPLSVGGAIELESGKKINLTRIHIEEDPASITYPKSAKNSDYSLIDYNRSGNPLVEIVTEPELTTPDEAREFLNKLISVLNYLKIFDMKSGIIKADANISIKGSGYRRVEVKNITGFKEIERALEYELERQKELVKEGTEIVIETRGWDAKDRETYSLRKKETEEGYGYIIEPDLVKIDVNEELIGILKKEIPELAHKKAKRFIKEYKIDKVDAKVMAMELELGELFEKVVKEIDPILAGRWLRRELLRVLNYNKKTLQDIKIDESHIIELLSLIETKTITEATGKKLIEMLIDKPFSPKDYVEKNELAQITSEIELEDICKKIVSQNEKAVEDYKGGEEKSFNFLVGMVMRETKGKANPVIVKDAMKRILS